MNLFKLMTINNYGRTREVLFTSSLSYLLDPSRDHGLSDTFLKKFLEQLRITTTKEVEVSSEKYLGKEVGNIDIFIETETDIVGIEAKIWDDSAVNNSKNNEAQLERYCKALKALSEKNKNWTLVFLIPYKDAPKCVEEFEKIKKQYPENVKLLVWKWKDEGEKNNRDKYYLEYSIFEMIENIITNYPIDTQDRVVWLLESLVEYIPNFVDEEKKYESRFPTKEDLETNCSDLWQNLIEPFCTNLNKNVNSTHTTIGFSYGHGNKKASHKEQHGNTLFRIRTAKDYYYDMKDKEKNYPDALEIEIWEDIYNKIKDDDDWKQWLSKIGNPPLDIDEHINEKKREKIMLLRIEEGKITKEQVKNFEEIMKRGFEETINQNLC